jgi:DNA helicase-2/ATP-dependent DNA helicase PcrA
LRRLYSQENYPRPSRFLKEIPTELMQDIRIRTPITRPATVARTKAADSLKTNTYKAGQKVSHAKFGMGIVLQTEGEGSQEKIQVNFKTEGMKWLMLAYAKLDILS